MLSMLILSPWCEQHEIKSNTLDLVRGFFIPIQSKDVLFSKYMPSSMPFNVVNCLVSRPTPHVTLR